jgi:hypothetical protein
MYRIKLQNDTRSNQNPRYVDQRDQRDIARQNELRREAAQQQQNRPVANPRVWIAGHYESGFLGLGRKWVEGHWENRG